MTGTFVLVSESQRILEKIVNAQRLTRHIRGLGSSPRRDWFATRGLPVAVAVFNHQVKPDRLLSNSAIRANFRVTMGSSFAEAVCAEIESGRIGLCLGVARCNPA